MRLPSHVFRNHGRIRIEVEHTPHTLLDRRYGAWSRSNYLERERTLAGIVRYAKVSDSAVTVEDPFVVLRGYCLQLRELVRAKNGEESVAIERRKVLQLKHDPAFGLFVFVLASNRQWHFLNISRDAI